MTMDDSVANPFTEDLPSYALKVPALQGYEVPTSSVSVDNNTIS